MDGHHQTGVSFLSIGVSVLTVLLGLAERWITYKDLMHTVTLAAIGGTVGWVIQRLLNQLVQRYEKFKNSNTQK